MLSSLFFFFFFLLEQKSGGVSGGSEIFIYLRVYICEYIFSGLETSRLAWFLLLEEKKLSSFFFLSRSNLLSPPHIKAAELGTQKLFAAASAQGSQGAPCPSLPRQPQFAGFLPQIVAVECGERKPCEVPDVQPGKPLECHFYNRAGARLRASFP